MTKAEQARLVAWRLRVLPAREQGPPTDRPDLPARRHFSAGLLQVADAVCRTRGCRSGKPVPRAASFSASDPAGGLDDQEFHQFLDHGGIADGIHLFNDKLREWQDHYNYDRPHGALAGQTPCERLLATARAGVSTQS